MVVIGRLLSDAERAGRCDLHCGVGGPECHQQDRLNGPGPIDLNDATPVRRAIMLQLVACVVCGGDPAVDSMLINSAISGALATPWIFRTQLAAVMRRVRGRQSEAAIGDACPLPPADRRRFGEDEADSSDV